MKTKVFLSWSGPLSRELAETFRDWVKPSFHLIDPFFSQDDIDKGRWWSQDLAVALQEYRCGILFVTRDNTESPWLNFEAGALTKLMDSTMVAPLLFGMNSANLKDPLAKLNATEFSESDVRRLMSTVNNQLGEDKLNETDFNNAFANSWPRLNTSIAEIMERHQRAREDPVRSEREMIEETLMLARSYSRQGREAAIKFSARSLNSLMHAFINLRKLVALGEHHEGLMEELEKMAGILVQLSDVERRNNPVLDELSLQIANLEYRTQVSQTTMNSEAAINPHPEAET